jgi:phage-related protein
MKERFEVAFLPDAVVFMNQMDDNAREKMYFNIRKVQIKNDIRIFKKLNTNIWEFRCEYQHRSYRLFSFLERSNNKIRMIVATHGMIKKSQKTPTNEIYKAEQIRKIFLQQSHEK